MTNHPIPPSHIITQSITINIADHPMQAEDHFVEFIVKTTVYGEVLEVENMFLQLPKEAQLLTLGANYQKTIPRLEGYKELIHYKIPFLFLGRIKAERLQPIIESIQQKREELGLKEGEINLELIQDEWTKKLYSYIRKYGKLRNDKGMQGMKPLEELLDESKVENHNTYRNLAYYESKFAAPVIRNNVSWKGTHHGQSMAFEALAAFPSEENRNFLIQHFKSTSTQNLKSRILKGLSVYKDQDTYQLVLNHYLETENFMGDELGNLLKCLSNFKTEEVKDIAWAALLGRDKWGGQEALRILKDQRISERELMERLLPVFYDEEKSDHLYNILGHFHHIKNANLLPPAEDLIGALVRGNKKRSDLNVAYSIPSLIAKKYTPRVPDQLHQLLRSPHNGVRKAAIVQISVLYFQYKKVNLPIKKSTWELLKELVEDPYDEVAREATSLVGRLSSVKKDPAIIEILLKKADHQRVLVQLDSMRAINNILHHSKSFDASIVPFYLKALKHQNQNVRIAAINGLKYSNNPQDLKRVEAMIHDPVQEVRKAVEDFKKYPLR